MTHFQPNKHSKGMHYIWHIFSDVSSYWLQLMIWYWVIITKYKCHYPHEIRLSYFTLFGMDNVHKHWIINKILTSLAVFLASISLKKNFWPLNVTENCYKFRHFVHSQNLICGIWQLTCGPPWTPLTIYFWIGICRI